MTAQRITSVVEYIEHDGRVIKGDNADLIQMCASLWFPPGAKILDVTYGGGKFWTLFTQDGWTVENPWTLSAHDLALDLVDYRRLPESDASVDVWVFDPAYISPGGRETSTIPAFNAAYGLVAAPRTPTEVDRMIVHGMAEGTRVLRCKEKGYAGGIALVKCMDYVSSGRLHQGHLHVQETAKVLGLTQVDEFVHFSGTGPQPLTNPDGTPRRQVHARSAHSFLCVFRKDVR